jgi:hypothetical protein
MMTEEEKFQITWAPKVKQSKLLRLYQTDAQGLVDEDQINEVGTALYWRCESIIMVTEANRVNCPHCDDVIRCPGERWSRACPVVCTACGWKATYGQWRDSWRHRDLHGGNAMYAYKRFVENYPEAKSAQERMLHIDQLINAYHWSMRRHRYHGPAANQLIQGKPADVIAFLDHLSRD